MASSPSQALQSPSLPLVMGPELSDIIETINLERKKLEEEREAFEKEKLAWLSSKSKLETSQPDDLIMLNVGGSSFVCSTEILRKIPDTYFSGLVSGRWNLPRQKDGAVFIDRDPTVFPLIMTYLRLYGTDFDLSKWYRTLSDREKLLLEVESEFYILPDLVKPLLFIGDILNADTWKSIHPSYETLKLLFTTSYHSSTFNESIARMKGNPNMIVVCKLQNGVILGAFTSIAWTFSNHWQSDFKAFVFYQEPGCAITKHAFTLRGSQSATSQNSSCVSFGEGNGLSFNFSYSATGQNTVTGSHSSFYALPIELKPPQLATITEIWCID